MSTIDHVQAQNEQLILCRELAKKLHKDQKYGHQPYYDGHLSPVANKAYSLWLMFDSSAHLTHTLCAAYLHDSVEDGHTTFEGLEDAGVKTMVVNAVRILTRPVDMSYEDYIERIVGDYPVARIVKLADLICNLTSGPTPDQVIKYTNALKILTR